MQLVSYRFLFFLLILFAVYYITPRRAQWTVLLAASCVFYASGGTGGLTYLFCSVLSTWILALWIGRLTGQGRSFVKERGLSGDEKRAYNASVKKKQRALMLAGVVFNFGILAVLKYTNFFLGNVNAALSGAGYEFPYVDWLLPLGISYYTFQSMGYLIDVYHRKYEPERNPFRFALFVSFFPQMTQGPVSRFDELSGQLFAGHEFEWNTVRAGLVRILWGYFKKLAVADRIAPAVAVISGNPAEYQGAYVWAGMLLYTLMMYGDFTGGIDIALGVAELFGVKLPENFDRPFLSRSLSEFWRRWHMSLMRWFREYIFFPVSTSRASRKCSDVMRRLFGKGAGRRAPLYLASITVWFITGIWHGASWNFVSWGLANCAALLISQELSPLYKRFRKRFAWTETGAYRAFETVRTFIVFSMLEMFEYYPFPAVFSMFGSMLFRLSSGSLPDGRLMEMGLSAGDWFIAGLSVILMIAAVFVGRKAGARAWLFERPAWLRFLLIYGLFLVVIVFGAYGRGYDAGQFIYNQF